MLRSRRERVPDQFWLLGVIMPIRTFTKCVLRALLMLAVAGGSLLAQQTGMVRGGKELKTVSIAYTSPTSAAQMYENYCAVCHGLNGRGGGPAAGFLKAPPPDLTTMARRNNGKYPASHVKEALRLGVSSHARAAIDMPLWGPLLGTLDANQSLGELRMHNLTVFVGTMQQK